MIDAGFLNVHLKFDMKYFLCGFNFPFIIVMSLGWIEAVYFVLKSWQGKVTGAVRQLECLKIKWKSGNCKGRNRI